MSVKMQGFSLIEMLIAMALSGVLMLGAMRLLPQLQGQNIQLMTQIHLDEELQQLMMTLEKAVRRAGYCNGQCSGEGLQIADSGRCILIRWDENSNGRWEEPAHAESEFYGYRLRNENLEMQRGVSSCEGSGWERLTDPQVVTLTQFYALRDNRTIKLRLGGYHPGMPARAVALEQWTDGMNLP
ncbi:prepilin peptidase-dependent protein [Winslowiella arboricola]